MRAGGFFLFVGLRLYEDEFVIPIGRDKMQDEYEAVPSLKGHAAP